MKRRRIITIDLENVSKKFDDDSDLFSNITLSLPIGKIMSIEGPPGSGKSILLRMIAGLVEPTTGRVLYNQIDLDDMSFETFNPLRMSTSFGFETGGLLMNKTLEENLKMGLLFHHQWRHARSEALMEELVDHFDLGKFLKLRPSSVSAGIRKIAGLVRVFLSNAQVMFLDEPTIGVGDKGLEALKWWLKQWEENRKKDDSLIMACSDHEFTKELRCERYALSDSHLVPLDETAEAS